MHSLYFSIFVLAAAATALGSLLLKKRERNEQDFLFLNRSLGLFTSVATLVASTAGVWILFTPIEATINFGILALIGYALGQALPFIVIAVLGTRLLRVLPAGRTLPEWAQLHYGRRTGLLTLGICLFYMFLFLTAELTAIGKVASVLTDVPLTITVPIIALATWFYTVRGGFRAVVLTDRIQLCILIPILLLVFLIIAFQTEPKILSRLGSSELVSLSHRPGWSFGFTLIIAIIAAQLFNQSLWRRVYACRDLPTMRSAFILSALVTIPLILLIGSFGFLAYDLSLTQDPETGLFQLMDALAPAWLLMLFIVAAVMLVMSSMDSLLNSLAGLAVQEMTNWRSIAGKNQSPVLPNMIRLSRYAISAFALFATLLALPGYSVLYLFLIADMLCAGTAFPLFYGLYSRRTTQRAALLGAMSGIISGIFFMPKPDFTPLIAHSFGSSWLYSFIAAVAVSCLVTLCVTAFTARPPK